jgi:hypothetical protein
MSRSTYYVVQTDGRRAVASADGNELTANPDRAMKFSTYHEAYGVYRKVCAKCRWDFPLRYPRIVKVTVETKTVKDRR